jgi:hypothetical protein
MKSHCPVFSEKKDLSCLSKQVNNQNAFFTPFFPITAKWVGVDFAYLQKTLPLMKAN